MIREAETVYSFNLLGALLNGVLLATFIYLVWVVVRGLGQIGKDRE